jgi:polyisoprenoid-binding protein YceI
MRTWVVALTTLAALGAFSLQPAANAATAAPAASSALQTEAPAGAYKVDSTHASITWKVSHLGLSFYTARFTKWDADLNFDPADPAKNSVSVTIDPNSIRTDYPYVITPGPNGKTEDFDKKLAADPGFFNSAKFPTITFKSKGVERTGDKTAIVTGDLTLLGVTKPVVIDATFNGGLKELFSSKTAAVGFSGVTKIKRSDFGFTAGAPYVGDDVEILIEAEFHKAPPAGKTK